MKQTAMSAAILSLTVWAGAQTYGSAAADYSTGHRRPDRARRLDRHHQRGRRRPHPQVLRASGHRKQRLSQNSTPTKWRRRIPMRQRWRRQLTILQRSFPTANYGPCCTRPPCALIRAPIMPTKPEAMGRKVLAMDADDPEALVIVSEVIAERTRETDLDKDQRYDEAMKMAQKATQTVETDVSFNAGTPQEKIDAYKSLLRSNAYSVMGTIDFKKDSFAAAQDNLQKSIDAYPAQPDPVVVLRLALSLDKQNKYPDALKVANRAVGTDAGSSQIGTLARRERDRLQQLHGRRCTGGCSTRATQPPKN